MILKITAPLTKSACRNVAGIKSSKRFFSEAATESTNTRRVNLPTEDSLRNFLEELKQKGSNDPIWDTMKDDAPKGEFNDDVMRGLGFKADKNGKYPVGWWAALRQALRDDEAREVEQEKEINQRMNARIAIVDPKAPKPELNQKETWKPAANRTSEDDLKIVKSKFNFDQSDVRYGYLLFNLFKKSQALGNLDAELQKIVEQLEKSEEFRKVVTDPLMSNNARISRINKYLEKSPFDNLTNSFISTLAGANRLQDLPETLVTLQKIREQIQSDSIQARIVSTEKLSDAQREAIKKVIQTKFNPQGNLIIKEEINPKLEGGYEVYYDNKHHFDNSLKTIQSTMVKQINDATNEELANEEKQQLEDLENAKRSG